jgi:hypothetical protein
MRRVFKRNQGVLFFLGFWFPIGMGDHASWVCIRSVWVLMCRIGATVLLKILTIAPKFLDSASVPEPEYKMQ